MHAGTVIVIVAGTAMAIIAIGLWIDWSLNWKKKDPRKEPRGFDVIQEDATPAAGPASAAGDAAPSQTDLKNNG